MEILVILSLLALWIYINSNLNPTNKEKSSLAKDKETGKEQPIIIKDSSGLSEEETQKIIKLALREVKKSTSKSKIISEKNKLYKDSGFKKQKLKNNLYGGLKDINISGAVSDYMVRNNGTKIDELVKDIIHKIKYEQRTLSGPIKVGGFFLP